jgi:hypothetical protein
MSLSGFDCGAHHDRGASSNGKACRNREAVQETGYVTVDFSLPGVEKKLPYGCIVFWLRSHPLENLPFTQHLSFIEFSPEPGTPVALGKSTFPQVENDGVCRSIAIRCT